MIGSGSIRINGRVPSVLLMRYAVRRGKLVQVLDLPEGVKVEEVLMPFLHEIRRLQLSIGSNDYSFLQDCLKLEELSLWTHSTKPIDFSRIPLQSFSGYAHKNVISLRDASSLTELYLDSGNVSWVPSSESLERLSLHPVGKDADLSELHRASSLRYLSMTGRGSLDLAPLAQLRELERIDLYGFREITNSDSLLEILKLKHVVVENVRSFENPNVLHALGDRAEVVCVGNERWAREFRTSAHQ